MKPILLLLTVFLLSLNASQAQNQHEMNQAAAAESEKADAELNKIYKKVLAAEMDEEGVKLLKSAQKAWIAFRDAEAKHAEDEARGGSMAPLLYYSALARVTKDRTKQLEQQLVDEEVEIPIVLPEGGTSAKAACEAFFKAYKAHNRSAATVVAVERALAKTNWDPTAAKDAKLSFSGDNIIIYEGGHMELKTQKTALGAWFVVDIDSVAD
jgi:uncharacterized protein YecT (DUF1311 family)